MSRDLAKILRQNRAQEDAWIGAYLEAASFGFLATVDDGQPFLNSNLFAYVDETRVIYLHTARQGRDYSPTLDAGRYEPFIWGTLPP